MSWLSKFVRDHFAHTQQETATQIVMRLAGTYGPEIVDYAKQIIASLDSNPGINNETKTAIVHMLVDSLSKSIGVTLPGWLINWLVQELVGMASHRQAQVNGAGATIGTGGGSPLGPTTPPAAPPSGAFGASGV
jgi:hypothetical protein